MSLPIFVWTFGDVVDAVLIGLGILIFGGMFVGVLILDALGRWREHWRLRRSRGRDQ